MQWVLRPRTLLIVATLVIILPLLYWLWTFYQVADLLTSLGTADETTADTLSLALSLLVDDVRKAPAVYVAPILAGIALMVISQRRR